MIMIKIRIKNRNWHDAQLESHLPGPFRPGAHGKPASRAAGRTAGATLGYDRLTRRAKNSLNGGAAIGRDWHLRRLRAGDRRRPGVGVDPGASHERPAR